MIASQELDEVNNKLIKVKMTSVRYEKTHSQAEGQQQVQELQQRLIMVKPSIKSNISNPKPNLKTKCASSFFFKEKDINRKLEKENLAERAEKQVRN